LEDKIKIIENIYETMPIIHKKLMNEMHVEGYTKHQVRVMLMIKKHEGNPMNFYVHKMMMNKSNFSNLVESLIIEGIIERVNSSEDRRVNHLFITREGNEFLERCRNNINENFLKRMEALSEEEVETLAKSFAEIRRIFEKI
jgi:DNA-binding MarR family transcriptional regulator